MPSISSFGPIARIALRVLSLAAIPLLAASCGGRYITGGSGGSSPEIHAIPPARAANVSFQTALTDDAEPAIDRLADGDAIACQIIDPLHFGLTRFDGSLHARWSRTIELEGPAPEGPGPYGLPRLAPAAERPIRLIASDREGALLSYRSESPDSIALLYRRFDVQSGELRENIVLHRTRMASTLRQDLKLYRSVLSPNGALAACYVVSKDQSGIQREIDIHVFDRNGRLVKGKRITATGRSSRDSLRAVAIDDGGRIYILHQDDRNNLTLLRVQLQGNDAPERLTIKVSSPDAPAMRLLPVTMRMERDGSISVFGPGRTGPYLTGCAVVRVDPAKWVTTMLRFVPITAEMLGSMLSTDRFERPVLHSVLDGAGRIRWLLLLEERLVTAAAAQGTAPAPGAPGNLITIALDSSGLVAWLRGTSKIDRRDGPSVTSGVVARAVAGEIYRIFYTNGSDMLAREYVVANGAEASPVPRRLLTTGGTGTILFPYIFWTGEREMLLTILTGKGEDMKLTRLDLGSR